MALPGENEPVGDFRHIQLRDWLTANLTQDESGYPLHPLWLKVREVVSIQEELLWRPLPREEIELLDRNHWMASGLYAAMSEIESHNSEAQLRQEVGAVITAMLYLWAIGSNLTEEAPAKPDCWQATFPSELGGLLVERTRYQELIDELLSLLTAC